MAVLYDSLECISEMGKKIEDETLRTYFGSEDFASLSKKIQVYLSHHLHIEVCSQTPKNDGDAFILKEERFPKFGGILRSYRDVWADIKEFQEKLNGETDHVKIHTTEKSGISFQMTQPRMKLLKQRLPDHFLLKNGQMVNSSELSFQRASSSTTEIEHPFLSKTLKMELILKEKLSKAVDEEYHQFLKTLESDWYDALEKLAHFVGKLDVLLCRAFVAMEYHYCCPVLEESQSSSSVKAMSLRHPLIEQINGKEIYVANNVELNGDGILLFGINSSGKTSLMRALGISVILAQAGCFVPCTSFYFNPYRAIFSRIVGNDNLFRGLSSFAVEMSELKVILRMADAHSLVLADEISKGSEMDSAMSITTAALVALEKSGASFMVTSHLHEIVGFDELRDRGERIRLKHLSVTYDMERDSLIYDRILKDGSGESFYGLLVCKSLQLPLDFIEMAYHIRGKYLGGTQGILSMKSSVYNARKLAGGLCEKCGEVQSHEIHHLVPQSQADQDGFLSGGIHKNHPANLSAVCEKCHEKIHRESLCLTRKKTTKGYILA
jgi:DNA mismatch repair protein MutS